MDRFGNVVRFDFVAAFHIGDGARDFEDFVVGARRESHLFNGGFEDFGALRVDLAIFADVAGQHLGVGKNPRELFLLLFADFVHALADCLRRLSAGQSL